MIDKIAFDIDGVVADIIPQVLRLTYERGYTVKDINIFDISIIEVESESEREELITEILEELYVHNSKEILPYVDAKKYIPMIKALGIDITFLTARLQNYIGVTEEWLKNYFKFPFILVHRNSSAKTMFLKQNKYKFLVEDRLKTANIASESGITTFLINRDWNMGRPTHKDVIRIITLEEVLTFAKNHE